MKQKLNKATFFVLCFITQFSQNKALIKRKIILGSVIAGLITASSCKVFKPPVHKCYSPVMNDPEQVDTNEEDSGQTK